MRARRGGLAGLLLGLTVLTGCHGSGNGPLVEAVPTPTATGSVSQAQLERQLLQAADLPGLGPRRTFASNGLTTQGTPQLSLCRAAKPVAPHEVANVIADSAKPGGVKVFEVLSVFPDEAAARSAFSAAVADTKACLGYSSGGIAHRITALSHPQLGPGTDALQYALVTSDVVSGDVRTLARRGACTVLVSGFGAPPTRQPLLAYQLDVMRKALARLH